MTSDPRRRHLASSHNNPLLKHVPKSNHPVAKVGDLATTKFRNGELAFRMLYMTRSIQGSCYRANG